MSDTGEVRITSSTGGQKGSKPARFDLIPPGPLRELAEVYGKGAEKYDDHNWLNGYDWSLSYAALQRHLNAFWGGEDYDPESGQPHMAHAAWHCFTLLEFLRRFPEFDNRPPRRPEKGIDVIIDGHIDGTTFETHVRPGEIDDWSIETPVTRPYVLPTPSEDWVHTDPLPPYRAEGGFYRTPPDPTYLVN